jgi:hypothetical protein
MLTEKQFEGLKKINLSKDPKKTGTRISADFKEASADLKSKIMELSGLGRSTFYNAFLKGTASPKMVLAMAQILGVSPYYYTGEKDEKGKFNDVILNSFLKENNLLASGKKKTADSKAKAKAKPKAKSAAAKPASKPADKATPKPAVAKPVAKATPKPATAKAKAKPAAKKAVKKPVTAKPAAAKPAQPPKPSQAKDEVFIQVSIPKSLQLQKAVNNLDEESAVLLLRALIRKADASENAKALCDIIKSCLLS